MQKIHDSEKHYMDVLPSINFSIDSYKHLVNQYVQNKEKYAVCLINVNNFNIYNHIFGYEYGNKILLHIFTELKKHIKEKGKIFRFGVDTLLILLWDIKNKNEVECMIKYFLNNFENFYEFMDHTILIELQIGAAIYPEDSYKIEFVLKYADMALCYLKQCNKEKYKIFDFNIHEEIVTKEIVEMDIINALAQKEFTLYYQPQINLATGKTYGVEALIRWVHPLYGLLPPSLFIDNIEKNGMVVDIGKWVVKEACTQLSIWHELGYNHIQMSINISVKQLRNKDFFYFVKNILEDTKINPALLCLEITEYSLNKEKEDIKKNLIKLKGLGLKIYLDNFGTAYSCLNHLVYFPINGIKINKSFIDDIASNPKKLIITQKIIELANSLGIDVIAEGVEQIEQLNYFKKINCKKIQGYLYGKPMSPKQVTTHFDK